MLACMKRHLDVAEFLLDEEADVNVSDEVNKVAVYTLFNRHF